MSQYEFSFNDGRKTVRFGWDQPLQTYYFQLKDNLIERQAEDPSGLTIKGTISGGGRNYLMDVAKEAVEANLDWSEAHQFKFVIDEPGKVTMWLRAVDQNAEKNPMLVWVGTKPHELYEIQDLIRATPQEYKSLVQRHEIQLYADKDDGK